MFALVCFLVGSASGAALPASTALVSFPGFTWIENNDPVMGGKSHGNWSVVNKSYGLFQGAVEPIPGFGAPGFCRAVTISLFSRDASEYVDGGLLVTARTST